tara:strand:- start:35284 stop:37167 length:1884 start_codon:yes stop_codon:yes gene_type:complete
MGLLDLYSRTAGTTDTPVQALPSTLGERVAATADETFAPDRYFMIQGSRRDMWQRAADELQRVTGEALPNPYMPVTTEEIQRLGNEPAVQAERRNRIIEASRLARAQGNDDLFDPENIDRYIGEEANRRRGRARDLEGTGNGFLNFLAAAGLETATPHGLVGLFVPVTRVSGATGVARSFLGNVLKEGAFQAGTNAALQAGAEGLDFLSRSETGSAQTVGEIATNIAGAAVIGGTLGGGLRALHLKWLGLPERVRADAPLEVKDAFRAIEAEALYSGQNRLGVDPLLHERYQGRAMDAILRGRPVDLADLSRTADTPLTALGTILRNEPAAIRADISGLGNAVDRVRALPDSEVESVLREARPDAFKQIDDIARRAAELDARVSQINSELEQIGLPDVVDLDTAARLQDIDNQLAKKGLRRQTRLDLEREREMITQSVDPRGRLTEELKTLRADFFPEQQKALKEIAEAREALAREREAAQSVVTREIEQTRNRLGSLSAGRQFADEVPADVLAREFGGAEPAKLGDAIQRADMMRQARIVRELMGDPASQPFRPAEPISTKADQPLPPEQVKALETETARLMENEAVASREVSIDGRTMSAREAVEDADRMAKDAQAALNCAIGAL